MAKPNCRHCEKRETGGGQDQLYCTYWEQFLAGRAYTKCEDDCSKYEHETAVGRLKEKISNIGELIP